MRQIAIMQYSRFVTGEKPWCVWDWDIKSQTADFLRSFDPTYFDYLANIHEERLDGEDARHAATAIRATYCHAMETLFALLCASVQAPDCIQGWIQKYRPQQLDDLVQRISDKQKVYTKIRAMPLSWAALVDFMLANAAFSDKTKEERVKKGFNQFWSRLAHEFLSEDVRVEYGSIKHGFRVGSGGSSMRIGEEIVPGVPAPPEAMQEISGGEFGSNFFESEELATHNIRLRRKSVNWSPDALAGRIRLISLSLRNIVGRLKVLHGTDPKSLQFAWPQVLDDFDEVWRNPPLLNMSMSTVIELKDIKPQSAEQIVAVYNP